MNQKASNPRRSTGRAPHVRTGVTVVGSGNWGTSLVAALEEAEIPVCEIVVRSQSAVPKTARKRAVSGATVGLDHAKLDAAILWICTPDSAIAETAAEIAARRRALGHELKGQLVLHSSGALNVDALTAAARAGAAVASIHPLMSFPTRKPVPLEGVPFGVEAAPALRRRLNGLVRKLGGSPFTVSSKNKALYHAAGTLASPLLLSTLVAAQEALASAGLTARQAAQLVGPIASATVRNFATRGPRLSFSGPIARGDVATIRLHLQALREHPLLLGVYRSLALHALESLPSQSREELRSILNR